MTHPSQINTLPPPDQQDDGPVAIFRVPSADQYAGLYATGTMTGDATRVLSVSPDYRYVTRYGGDVWTTTVSRRAYNRAIAANLNWYDGAYLVVNIPHALENYGYQEFFTGWTPY
jgi:hypothetical protein